MTATPPARPQPDTFCTAYRILRVSGVTNENGDAIWTYIHSELTKLGYTLTADETDWLPPDAARPPTADSGR